MRCGTILLAFAASGLAVPALAATLTTDLNGGADYTDTRAAIDAAAGGDTVLVKPGAYIITDPIDCRRRGLNRASEEVFWYGRRLDGRVVLRSFDLNGFFPRRCAHVR